MALIRTGSDATSRLIKGEKGVARGPQVWKSEGWGTRAHGNPYTHTHPSGPANIFSFILIQPFSLLPFLLPAPSLFYLYLCSFLNNFPAGVHVNLVSGGGSGDVWPAGAAAPPCRNPKYCFCFFYFSFYPLSNFKIQIPKQKANRLSSKERK